MTPYSWPTLNTSPKVLMFCRAITRISPFFPKKKSPMCCVCKENCIFSSKSWCLGTDTAAPCGKHISNGGIPPPQVLRQWRQGNPRKMLRRWREMLTVHYCFYHGLYICFLDPVSSCMILRGWSFISASLPGGYIPIFTCSQGGKSSSTWHIGNFTFVEIEQTEILEDIDNDK